MEGLSLEQEAPPFVEYMKQAMHFIARLMLLPLVIQCVVTVQAHAHITVLLYHKFDEADSPSTSTPTKMFAQQMEYLEDNGYRVLSMDELYRCISGKSTIPEKGVVITLDDGYLSEYTKAVPVLKAHKYPFCVFVFTRSVGAHNFMDWDQLREVLANGGDVGSHTHTHPHLVDCSSEEVRKEFARSKQILEENLGVEVKWFAYPFGDYDNEIRAMGRSAGYRLLLTSDPGSVGEGTGPDMVPRQAIVGQNMDMVRFKEKLSRPPMAVKRRSPERGRIPDRVIPRISVVIADPGQYYPGQVQMFISEKGRLDTRFDPESGELSCTGPVTVTKKVNRIITTARRKTDGLYGMDSFMIVLPEETTESASGSSAAPGK